MGGVRSTHEGEKQYNIWIGKSEEEKARNTEHRCECKMDLKEVFLEAVDWIHVAQDGCDGGLF